MDMIGMIFGNLIVVGEGDDYVSRSGKHYKTWLCRCMCGNHKTVMQCSLVTGHTKSCGCLRKQKMVAEKTTHGDTGTRLYNSWRAMKERCLNKNSEHYALYGGRGISLCDDWMDFDVFRSWAINNGYIDGATIDRIDVNAGYKPDNCRWATMKEQSNNKRNNHIITIDGVSHTLSEWSDMTGIKKATILARICKYGWDAERAVFEPVRKAV